MIHNADLSSQCICRQCLNELTGLNFKNYQLKYKFNYYHFKCCSCGKMHHIVRGVKIIYRWMLFFANDFISLQDEDNQNEVNQDKPKGKKTKQKKKKVKDNIEK